MATATVSPQVTASTYITALDGWRGIAILLVLVEHVRAALSLHWFLFWTQTGQHGVTLFFVLSGFLITMKLVENPGKLRNFYIRRFFRLMPAAWSYLAFLGVIEVMFHAHALTLADTASCIFFFRNYSPSHLAVTGHFWSLSIEEQFYLVWPTLLILAGVKRCRWIAIVGALGCAAYRFSRWQHYDHLWPSFRTEVRFDALLVGCLLALLFHDPKLRSPIARYSRLLTIPALMVFAFCIVRYTFLPPLYESVAIAVLIAASVGYPQSRLARLVSLRPLVWLGVVSYSIYVWQQFFVIHRNISVGMTLALVAIMPVFALGSYYLIENPCRRIGRRLTIPATPQSRSKPFRGS